MVTPKIPIIKKRTKNFKLMLFVWLSGILLLLLPLLFYFKYDKFNILPSQISGTIGMILIILNIILSLVLRKFTIIDHLTLMEDRLKIGDKEYFVKDLKNIKFTYWGYEGQSYKTAITGSLTPKSGINNYFSFENDSETFKFELYFQENSWLYFTLNIFKVWKQNDVCMKISGVPHSYLERFSLI
jgi:hypothetical protein